MRKLITVEDIRSLLRSGGSLDSIPADALLTPSARDLVRAHRPAAASVGAAARGEFPKDPRAVARFFASPELEALKVKLCDIGRRMWERGYVDGNGGNITVRVGDNLILCTPTLISKGFMQPGDMCLTDLEGRQLAGTRQRTSEALTHLGIMKRQPKARACVHAHPPHATAFADASVRPPPCLIPEAEVFIGQVGLAEYQTPGTPENANAVGRVGVDHQVVLMQNHGVITWGDHVEDAYWKMENIDAYCQTVWIASQLGSGLHSFGPQKLQELIAIRKKLGMDDARQGSADCNLCDPGEFRGGTPAAPTAAAPQVGAEALLEALVRRVADRVVQQLRP